MSMSDVTYILGKIESGDQHASADLLPLVYAELRSLAVGRMASQSLDHSLQATALVHEAYVRLVDTEKVQKWDSRGHFFAAAAEAMRRILVDRAREKRSIKRGGGMHRVELDADRIPAEEQARDEQLLTLDLALEALEKHDELKAKLVKLRYFAGLSGAQAAQAMAIGESTADKYWAHAKVWLRSEMKRIDACGH
jgi:RNA polymerase sigma factor (TIGR02999 family)